MSYSQLGSSESMSLPIPDTRVNTHTCLWWDSCMPTRVRFMCMSNLALFIQVFLFFHYIPIFLMALYMIEILVLYMSIFLYNLFYTTEIYSTSLDACWNLQLWVFTCVLKIYVAGLFGAIFKVCYYIIPLSTPMTHFHKRNI